MLSPVSCQLNEPQPAGQGVGGAKDYKGLMGFQSRAWLDSPLVPLEMHGSEPVSGLSVAPKRMPLCASGLQLLGTDKSH